MKSDDYKDEIKSFIKVLDENIDLLSDIEENLDSEKENEVITDIQLHQLLDLVEDVAESAKIKRAQNRFNQRQNSSKD